MTVPSSSTKRLRRAIGLRKLHHRWHLAQAEAGQVVKNDGHGYFIRILEKVQHTLQSFALPAEPSAATVDPEPSGEDVTVVNAFNLLAVEDPVDSSGTRSGQDDLRKTCTLDTTEDSDARRIEGEFAHFCLLQDLHDVRVYLRLLWQSYSEGAGDLSAISITTNTAIDFVRNLQKEFEAAFPGHEPPEFPICPSCRSRITRADDLTADICLVSARKALSVYITSSLVNQDPSKNIRQVAPALMELYSSTADRASMSYEEGLLQDFRIVMSIIPELQLLVIRCPRGVQAEHEILRGMRELVQRKEPILWVTFAFQLYLDIRHILRENVVCAYDDFMQSTQAIKDNVSKVLAFHADAKVRGNNEILDQEMKEALDVITYWTVEDFVADRRHGLMSDSSAPYLLPKHYLLKRDPLWCGLLLYNCRLIAYESMIATANTWLTILPAAHLYNRLRHDDLLESCWSDMDQVFRTQSIENLFVGGLPSTPLECAKRISLAMGYRTAGTDGNGRRLDIRLPTVAKVRKLKTQIPVHESFAHRYRDESHRVDFTPTDVEKILTRASPETARATGIVVPERAAVVCQLLDRLTSALEDEVTELMFDFGELHTICWELMRRLHAELGPRVVNWPYITDIETKLPAFVLALIGVPAVVCPRSGSELLKDAGKIVDEFLGTRGEAVLTKRDALLMDLACK
ncbi:unnamed protein product [Zymoseptoria tritici ST99CH_1A5]|uniref:DUF6604 domain-containing protein n=1 Tax=Zymoseptoria tritici ST99CH_1A5 TaxID=1276529 RepID=A0A1Y6LSY8_ZYMTR|nr:unnamed protein product [Zymoseptoria tritici ST99CH_1A5]